MTRAMPPPGDVAYLGTMLELEHGMPDGSVVLHEWKQRDAPLLFWSPDQRALFAFPGLELTPPSSADASPVARRAFKSWTGRRPRHVRQVKLPELRLNEAGQGGHIVYRSNKWGTWTNYIHEFAPGTTVELGAGELPRAFVVRGPPLRLTSRGLVD